LVCRQLGYVDAYRYRYGSHFGLVPEEFSYDDVKCDMSANSLDECPHSNTDNCGSTEGAGVICYNGAPIGNV